MLSPWLPPAWLLLTAKYWAHLDSNLGDDDDDNHDKRWAQTREMAVCLSSWFVHKS